MKFKNIIFSLFIISLYASPASAQNVLVPQSGGSLSLTSQPVTTDTTATAAPTTTSATVTAPAQTIGTSPSTTSTNATPATSLPVGRATKPATNVAISTPASPYLTADQQNRLIAAQKGALAAVQSALDGASQSNATIGQNVQSLAGLSKTQANQTALAFVTATGSGAASSTNSSTALLQLQMQQIQHRLAILTAGPLKTADVPKLFSQTL